MAQERAEALARSATEQGFAYYLARGTILRGWALAQQGQGGGDGPDTPGARRLAGHGGRALMAIGSVPCWPKPVDTQGRRRGPAALAEALETVEQHGGTLL